MDLEVVGRHALLFDDDTMAAFVNSAAALVDWNSLSIDRYDVRHLLSAPPPPRSRRRPPDDPLDSDLDRERYLDLPSQDVESQEEEGNTNGYNVVPFSYGNPTESAEHKNTEVDSGFRPPFSMPEHLLKNLPPTEKLHQIIARTAMFVSRHGAQSEIVLRVKQGDNPTFGFLMPDHELHPYFTFLVDHQELLKSDGDDKSTEGGGKAEGYLFQPGALGGALTLLGSVYGSGEDEEDVTKDEHALANDSKEALCSDNVNVSHQPEQIDSYVSIAKKKEVVPKPSAIPLKEVARVIKKNRSIGTVKTGSADFSKKDGDSLGLISSSANKLLDSVTPGLSKVETSILEPPSDLKRVVDKIVEFILRNGKEFESVLIQQDVKHGRFPFLLPSNQYHRYYLKVLQNAQESKLARKGFNSEKHDSLARGLGHTLKESDSSSLASDIPHDSDRKEKFKMVIGKPKKDGQDPSSKASRPQVGFSVDAAAAAAILQAATKGIKNPKLELLTKGSMNDIRAGRSSEGGDAPSIVSNETAAVSVPLAKAIAKTAATAAASEADSSEASLTKEQKLKAERLKRAKMFAAMIKCGAAPLRSEPLRGLSVEPSDVSRSSAEVSTLVDREREGSSAPIEFEKPERKDTVDSCNEKRLKRKYRSRSERGDEGNGEDVEDEGEKEEKVVEEDRDDKHSKKKRRSHHSPHRSGERHKHGRKGSSSKDTDSRRQCKDSSISDAEHCSIDLSSTDDDRRHSSRQSRERHKRRRKGSSSNGKDSGHRHKDSNISDDERPSRDLNSTDDEGRHSRWSYKVDSSSLDERRRSRHSKLHYSPSDELKCSKRRHKHDSLDDDKHKYSQRRRKRNSASHDEYLHSQQKTEHDGPSDGENHQSPERRKYSSSDDKGRQSRRQHKHSSINDECKHESKAVEHEKVFRLGRETDLEEGEILTKSDQSKACEGVDGAVGEDSVDLSKTYKDARPRSEPPETTDVPDDLRAKIRAMLMATM
ncbi:hypothetical protein K2173_023817 [Erythroxylum novogranatense]|uniref:SURP motif domain-containing protein n=1 Tax=Erythroxylum novogranatense TaxID=1862640 RepID=A0AAV8TIA3_9ROSI|nr:hypothetical protein K2173_023817 [Erythroxylum novogranatense]